ncbi:MAG: hypothetical protein CMM91_03955 [Rickettsiales bacterium]|nr:hypothetical protein [Rickettsiales bacterium]OUV54198.1 MAG: hypothetical protein CBC87_02700 [Rickettsiales bacterium TMED127]|tara:strand:+ start:28426 stop:29319 length:894 start_codon:yes stop_codon:yes gene_type:complete
MTNFAIISDLHDWHSKQISNELNKLKKKVQLYNFDDLSIKIENKKNIVLFNNKIKKFDGIWVRFIKDGSLEEITFKLTILHTLKDFGTYIHNSAQIIEKTVDKFRASMIAKKSGILIPKTWVFSNKRHFIEQSKNLFRKQKYLIIKPIFGSQGKGVQIFKNLKDIDFSEKILYFQEYIGNLNEKIFSDVRVIVSKHKTVCAIKRVSKNPITNVALGSKVEKIKISRELKKISIKISKIFELGYGGIDFKIFKNKIYLLEINSIPAWKATQTVEKKKISKILVDDFLSIAREFNVKTK